jgi:hypothetical protein
MKSWLNVYTELSVSFANAWAELRHGLPQLAPLEQSPFAGTCVARAFNGSAVSALEDDVISHCIRWRKFGAPTFRLTHGLTAGLLLTDPARLPWSEVRLPFPSFVVSLPPGMIFFDDFDGSLIEATFATVHIFDAPKVSHAQYSDVIGMMGQNPLGAVYEMNRMPFAKQVMVRVFSDGDRAKLHHTMPLPDNDAATTVQEVFGFDKIDEELKLTLTGRDVAAMTAVCRVIVGLAQYLASHDESGDAVWAPSMKPNGRAHGSNSWDVGRSVKLSREVREAATAYTRHPGSDAWKVSSRHVVRGHMHAYWYGAKTDPASREKRSRWVAPFWRGPEDGPVAQRLYDVEQ